jgi:hypothetical protein
MVSVLLRQLALARIVIACRHARRSTATASARSRSP